jgi:hypothetical protein
LKVMMFPAFRHRIMGECEQRISNVAFDWTSMAYFGCKPDLAKWGHSKDRHPE